MAKNSITDYSKTAASNTDIQSVDIAEGCLPSGINNAIRELMADLADMNDGTVSLTSPSFAAASLTGNLSFGDSDKAIFGAGNDLEILHDGTNSVIRDNGSGNLSFQTNGSKIAFYDQANSQFLAEAFTGAGFRLYYDGSQKFVTQPNGVNVTGTVTADGLTVDGVIKFSGLAPTVDYDFNASGSVTSADSLQYALMATGKATTTDISSVDTITPSWSALSGSIYSDNKFRIMSARGNATDALRIASSLTAEGHGDTTIIGNVDVDGVNTRIITGLSISGGDVELLSNDSRRINIAANGDIAFFEDTGTTAKLTWDASEEDLKFADNSKAIFGAGNDLQIYHTGSDSVIADGGIGNLNILGDADVAIINAASTEYKARFITDGAVELYYNGTQKLATTTTGIDVTGTASTDGLTVIGAAYIQSATAPQLELAYNSGNITGFYRSGGDFQIKNDNGAGTPETSIVLAEDGAVSLYYDASAKLATTSTGINVTGTVTADGLTVSGSGFIAANISSNSTSETQLRFNTNTAARISNQANTALIFDTNATERMRIDSSGNVLVGTTTTDPNSTAGAQLASSGRILATVDGGNAGYFNRLTSDGELVRFEKDGTTVGSIGTQGGRLTIGDGDTGLRFADDFNNIQPFNVSTNGLRDNAIDLGSGAGRFRSLFLSGGVYLGGTGSANKLDDYEEGTWTPTVAGDSTGVLESATIGGYYTKVGNQVTVYFNFRVTTNFSSSYIGGLPFQIAHAGMPSGWITGGSTLGGANNTVSAGLPTGGSTFRLFENNNLGDTHTPNTSLGYYRFHFSYRTTE